MSGQEPTFRTPGTMARLARDASGNTLALLAAAILPLLGIVGGGVDMGRAYLAESRLQQACDAGVLAARKKLGTTAVVTGSVPSDVATMGNRFFNINYRSGIYGTDNRQFRMTLNSDFSIAGTASVDVPTTIMGVFGFEEIPVAVECEANLNFSAVDVMMVLDVTGSMRHTNPGDSLSRIDSMKQVIRNFHAELESSRAPGSEVRYGFVPYATNVNVGHLLKDEWVTDEWTYQSRIEAGYSVGIEGDTYERNWTEVSGTRGDWNDWNVSATYAATYHESGSGDTGGWYTCDGAQPADTLVWTEAKNGAQRVEIQASPPAVLTIQPMRGTENGRRYRTRLKGTTCELQYLDSSNYVQDFERVAAVPELIANWRYAPIQSDVSNWRAETKGCVEERSTYQINDYAAVNLDKAMDLDIDTVPTPGDSDTQWRPMYPAKIYVREIAMNGTGTISTKQVVSDNEYADTGNWWFSDCPTGKAQKLAPMKTDELNAYLDTLVPMGATYHDIGMIWGARLISPTGLFASENGGTSGGARTRHIIFLTDGQTEPYDIAYGAYGVDALDQRRWSRDDTRTLASHVEQRFKVACLEAKKRNITVWTIAFGTTVNQAMVDCAGTGRYFEASNSTELNEAFISIAKQMADLRITE
ncbi:VWA domain-containing protein [Parerythrobacter lacustris]|uniref:VWA domain-containing protein n=1 Tax=Parerythrobacter lacustris TaxID=2969984 RepID=A0ABT1XRC5_9SPHN|nr:VWA domain-containing protein [Parerythrobacter lacustris]MCR2833782.1 VWA domain-containing protein [Parerythrobacter lacustris]